MRFFELLIFQLLEYFGYHLEVVKNEILFYYIIGNGDAHLKNFSIRYENEGQIRLAPAYDLD